MRDMAASHGFGPGLGRWAAPAVLMVCLLCLGATPGAARAEPAPGVGFRPVVTVDPVGGGPMEAAVFYPAASRTAFTQLGPVRVEAEQGADPVSGRHPCILLSHGRGGRRVGHHDLAEYLARNGFVVACIEHPGDNYRDGSGSGSARALLGRPAQCSALLDALLADPFFGGLIDAGKIGAAGFSAGGYTVLALAGARPDFSLFAGYCARHPDDAEICYRTVSPLANPDMSGLKADPRIRAVFAMAPLSIVFDAAGLAPVKVPVFLYVAAADRVLLPEENAERIAPLLGVLRGHEILAGVGHYVFLAPCSEELQSHRPDLCADAPGVDRAALHERINADALNFFRRELE